MNNLRRLRKELGMTQEDLERETGISQAMISAFENGEGGLTMSRILSLAEHMGTSVDYLLNRTDVEAPYPPGSARGNLRKLRRRAHLTQLGMEVRTRIDQSKLSKYERGHEQLAQTPKGARRDAAPVTGHDGHSTDQHLPV